MPFYPRNSKAKADAFVRGVPLYPRADQSRADAFLRGDDAFVFNPLDGGGIGLIGSLSLGEVQVSSGGHTIAFMLNGDEKWNPLLGAANAITSAFIGGIGSCGIAFVQGNLVRTTDKRATLTFPAVESYSIQSANFGPAMTIPRSCFTYRSSTWVRDPIFTIVNTSGND